MKNLFLTLAFVFATTFSFAGINSNETSSEVAVERACFDFTLSFGMGVLFVVVILEI